MRKGVQEKSDLICCHFFDKQNMKIVRRSKVKSNFLEEESSSTEVVREKCFEKANQQVQKRQDRLKN